MLLAVRCLPTDPGTSGIAALNIIEAGIALNHGVGLLLGLVFNRLVILARFDCQLPLKEGQYKPEPNSLHEAQSGTLYFGITLRESQQLRMQIGSDKKTAWLHKTEDKD